VQQNIACFSSEFVNPLGKKKLKGEKEKLGWGKTGGGGGGEKNLSTKERKRKLRSRERRQDDSQLLSTQKPRYWGEKGRGRHVSNSRGDSRCVRRAVKIYLNRVLKLILRKRGGKKREDPGTKLPSEKKIDTINVTRRNKPGAKKIPKRKARKGSGGGRKKRRS